MNALTNNFLDSRGSPFPSSSGTWRTACNSALRSNPCRCRPVNQITSFHHIVRCAHARKPSCIAHWLHTLNVGHKRGLRNFMRYLEELDALVDPELFKGRRRKRKW